MSLVGDWIKDHDGLVQAFLVYYNGLLGTPQTNRVPVSQSIINEGVVLNVEQQRDL